MNPELLGYYIEDLRDNLLLLDDQLIKLRQGTRDSDIINNIFRVAHTIKGNSAAMDFNRIERAMHTLEDILQEVRNHNRELNDAIIDVLYRGHDFLEDCLMIVTRDGSDYGVNLDLILGQLVKLKNQPITETSRSSILPWRLNLPEDIKKLVDVKCARGFNAYELEIALAVDGPMLAVTAWMVYEQVDQYAELIASDPPRPSEDSFRSSGYQFPSLTIRLLLASDNPDDLRAALANISDVNRVEIHPIMKKHDFVPRSTDMPAVSANLPVNGQEPCGEINSNRTDMPVEYLTPENPTPTYRAVNCAKTRQMEINPEKPAVSPESTFVRVPVAKVDSLMDMLGEMLILNSQLEVSAGQVGGSDASMLNVLSRNAKLIKAIQALSMSLRMVEMRPTLHRLTRIARDTAAELDKKVVINLEGETTEIDRSAVERFFDPLMHLVRNAVAHGIEAEADRVRAGKNPEGQVKIRCYSKRGNVYIEVGDDGRGIDPQAILSRARALQLADASRDYSDEEILRLIMIPGFSTQTQINSISGRGVGMNIVQEEITRAGGKVEIANTPGQGCTFILRIPMNLAVVNGTIVRMAGGRYIIPTLYIKEFFMAEKSDWVSMQGRIKAVRIRSQVLPVLWPTALLGLPTAIRSGERSELVVMELEQKLIALPVERIISRQEVVAKPLIRELSSIGYASGASILGDGTVALILDVEAMFSMIDGRC